MKALRTIMVVFLAIAVLSAMSFARVDKKNIVGGPHDLRYGTAAGNFNGAGGTALHTADASWAAASYTLCNFCHIAHKFSGESAGAPGTLLWNHTMSSATYSTYSSNYMTATVNQITADYNNPSALCLSCHDGTVAVNSNYAAVTAGTVAQLKIGAISGGDGMTINPADVDKQHPINFAYTADLATRNGMLKTPASLTSVDANGEIPLFNVGGVQGTMQCATCHEPHQKSGILTRDFYTAAGTTSAAANAAGWSWCLYCHSQSQI